MPVLVGGARGEFSGCCCGFGGLQLRVSRGGARAAFEVFEVFEAALDFFTFGGVVSGRVISFGGEKERTIVALGDLGSQ
jgi:hypothetical protein